MSSEDHYDTRQFNYNLQQSNIDKKLDIKSQNQIKTIQSQNQIDLITSQHIQRSAFIPDEELSDEEYKNQQQQAKTSKIFTSSYVTSQKQLSQKAKQIKSNNVNYMQSSTVLQNQQDEYESISSEKSSEQKKEEPIKNDYNKITQLATQSKTYKNNLNSLIQYRNKLQPQEQDFRNIKLKEMNMKNYQNIEVSQKKQQQYQQPHTTFQLSNTSKNKQQKQFSFSKQQISDNKYLSSQRSNRTTIQQIKESKEIQYPSIRSNSQDSASIKFQQKLSKRESNYKQKSIDFQDSIKSSVSQKNYAFISKKYTSQQPSPARPDSINKIFQIQEQNIKTKINQTPQKVGSQQESNLFYISTTGQVLYPSLDLKLKARQSAENINKQFQFSQDNKIKSPTKQLSKQIHVRKQNIKQRQQLSLPNKIRILQYRSQYFLKIQTQIFDIQVQYPLDNKIIQMKNMKSKLKQPLQQKKSDRNYKIKRRFSDFDFLYQGITINQIGYIIYPFPSKTLQSFVKIKLQSLIGATLPDKTVNTQAEKIQLIQRRIQDLQKFVNFLISHQELKYSQELAIFLCQDPQTYQRSRQRIQKYIQEYKQLQSQSNLLESGKKNIKKVIQTGMDFVLKWWSSSQSPVQDLNKKIQKSKQSRQMLIDTAPADDIQFGQYFETIAICLAKFQMLERSLLKLVQINEKFISFKDIDTQFDYLVKLCAKVSSGKQYSKTLVQLIEFDLIRDIQAGRRWLQQSKDQLLKREELKQIIENLKVSLTYSNDGSSKISKLERRLQRFQKNFRFGFKTLIYECEKIFDKSKQNFMDEWKAHCLNMKKIWK